MQFICFMAKIHAGIPDTINLAAIEVKASYIQEGYMVKQIGNQLIDGFIGDDLATLLSVGSHIHIKSAGPGGLSTASFRGTSANHTLVTWNDMPINAPNLGSVDFSTIPVFFNDQISVLWGSKALAERSGGLGGIVSLSNKPQFNSGFSMQVAQKAGSFGALGSFLSIGYGNRKVHVRSRLFRNSAKNDFDYHNYAVIPQETMRQQNADFNDHGFLQEVHWQAGKQGIISLITWNQWNNRNLPPIMTNIARGDHQKEFRNDRFHRNVLSYNYFLKKIRIDTRVGWFCENQHYYLKTTNGGPINETVTLIDSRNHAQAFMSSLNIEVELSNRFTLFTKYHADFEIVESVNYAARSSRNRHSIIVQGTYNAFRWLRAGLMIRQELASRGIGALLPSIEAKLIPNNKVPLFITASAGKNLRYPGLNDLYWFPGGNPALKPEMSRAADISVQWNPVTGNVQHRTYTNIYYSEISEWIQWRPTSYRYWEPVNIAKVQARGMEVGYQAETSKGNIQAFAGFNYAYTRTTDESPVARLENTDGKQLIYIPNHHANLYSRIERKGVFISYAFTFVGKRSVSHGGDDMLRNILNHYLLHHMSVGFDLVSQKSEWSFDFQIHNITDEEYQSVMWRPMPGRYFSFGLQYKLNGK